MKDIKKLILKFLIFIIPFLFVLGIYIIKDPFKSIYDYDSFYEDNKPFITINANYVSSYLYNKNHKRYNYDSFIFGNSRSIFYEINDWQKHLSDSVSCFHFDGFGEHLYTLWKKVIFIDKSGNNIKNALLIVDSSVLIGLNPPPGHLGIISPILDPDFSYFDYQKICIEDFISYDFLFPYLKYVFTGHYTDAFSKIKQDYNSIYNEKRYLDIESKIRKGVYYNPEKMKVFEGKQYPDSISSQVIQSEQYKMLKEIKNIFTEHNTYYKIVISPLYNQIKLSNEDLKILYEIFGKENVFDYSGVNEITSDYRNYYEDSHYRPHVSRMIMNEIYLK